MKKIGVILTLIILSILISGCVSQTGTPSAPSAPTSTGEEKKADSKGPSPEEIASKSQYGPEYGEECGYVKEKEDDLWKKCRCLGDTEIGKDRKIYCKGVCDQLSCTCYKGRDEVPCPAS